MHRYGDAYLQGFVTHPHWITLLCFMLNRVDQEIFPRFQELKGSLQITLEHNLESMDPPRAKQKQKKPNNHPPLLNVFVR